MKFYISRVLGNEVLLLNETLINVADVLFLFYFIKFVISGWDVTIYIYFHYHPKLF